MSRCTERIGESYGYDVSMIIWLKYINLSIAQKDNYEYRRTQVSSNPPMNTNFRIISELSALSWQIHDSKITLKEARIRFEHIMQNKHNGFFATAFLQALRMQHFGKSFR